MSEENAAPKRFKKTLKTLPVEIEGDDGTVELWTLRELSGTLRNKYLTAANKKVVMKNGVEVRDFTGSCSDLLTLCLFNPAGSTVTANVIDEWPSEMQLEIFQMAVKLSGLDKKAREEEEKN